MNTHLPGGGNEQPHPEECFRRLVEQSLVGIYFFQGDRFVYVNPRMAEIFGRTAAEMTSQSLYDLVVPEDRALAQENIRRRIQGEVSSIRYQLRMLHSSGRVLQIEVHGSVLSAYQGQPGLIGTLLDLSDQQQAANKLADDHRLLRTLLDNLPAYIFVKDTSGRYVASNAAHTHLVGATRESEVAGRTVFDFFPEEIARQFAEDDEAVVLTGQPVIEREEPYTARGESGWFLTTKVPLRDARNGIVGLVGIKHDISERKRTEEALRHAESKYHSIFENAVDGIFQTTPEGRYLMVNPAAARSLGYSSPAELMSERNDIARQGYLQPAQREEFKRLMATQGFVTSFEYQARRKDGSGVWISESARTVRDAAGNILFYEGTMEDIAGRKRAEERVREQAALLDLATDAILVRDLDNRVTFWNRGATRLYGWTPDEVIGRHVTDTYADPAWEGREAAREQVLEKGEWLGELQQRTKSGAKVIVQSRWTLLRDEDGGPRAVLVINTDITEKKKEESQFYRSQRLENIGTLAGGIAHDLNNILAPILMAVQFFRMRLEGDPNAQMLIDTLETSVERGAGMVKQVLAFGRGSTGGQALLQPRHIAKEVVKMAKQTFPKDIRIHDNLSGDLWTIKADATQLYQVFMNLCVNARDAMPGGGELEFIGENVLIDAQFAEQHGAAQTGPHVFISVRDTGCGMTPAIRERIFDAFFTTKELGKGTGLGLSTTLSIVKAHRGFIEVQTEAGRGSCFKIYIPATEGLEAPRDDGGRAAALRGNGEFILIVDDEQSVREILKATLESYGYRILLADDGAGALAVFAKHRGEIRAVLTDMMMPVMGGAATLNVLKRIAPDLHVIVSSGYVEDAKRAELKALGCSAFLPKPYSAEKLLTVLRDVLAGKIVD